jgi:hypothetical protein
VRGARQVEQADLEAVLEGIARRRAALHARRAAVLRAKAGEMEALREQRMARLERAALARGELSADLKVDPTHTPLSPPHAPFPPPAPSTRQRCAGFGRGGSDGGCAGAG